VLGTPSYMAPEQLAGEAVGPPADVFAWGATIAYAATGQAPYGQDTIPAVMHRIMTRKPDLGKLTGALHDLVAQCLRKEASRRPGSSEILLRLLEHSDGPISPSEALEQGRAVSAAHDEALADARTARWTTMQLSQADIPRENRHILKRRRALIAVSAVAVLAVTAAGAVAVVTSPTSEKHQTRTSSISSSPSIDLDRSDRRSSATPTPDPTSPTEIAENLDQAISARKTASITAEGGMDQSADQLKANGRFFYRPGNSTNYDVTVYNPDMQGSVEDDIGRPVRVILVGNTGYPQQVGARPVPADSASYEQTEPHVHLAMRTRWITSPYDLLALLRNASSLKRSSDEATHTFQVLHSQILER
jgi:serine/threonine protein kinase